MKQYIAQYTVSIGSRWHTFWIRDEYTPNTREAARRYATMQEAEDFVLSLNVPNWIECKVFECE